MLFHQKIIIFLLLIFVGLFYAEKINLTNSDIGRHIKNGEVFVKEHKVISTNYYSYTEPRFRVVNHHWGAGVIYYKIWKLFKFDGVIVLNILIYVLAFLLFFAVALKNSNFKYAILFGILSIPLITSRIEVRPEAFSYLFLGIFYYILSNFDKDNSNLKKLFILPILIILWVNLHIFFVTGIFLVGVYWFNSLFITKNKKSIRLYSIILGLCIIASLANPYGLKGLIEPFLIFKDYGYMVAENQSVPFMHNRFPAHPKYIFFEVIFVITVISFILVRKKIKNHLPEFLIALFFLILSWKINRFMCVWGFFFFPIVAANINSFEKNLKTMNINKFKRFLIVGCIIIIAGSFFFQRQLLNPLQGNKGIGLLHNNLKAASFISKNKVQGLIFNNYDIGGYLIFSLFPTYKVFVDNRPEAYSVSFFKDIFIPMQEDDNIWKKYENKYHFQIIFFNRLDMTPWGQPFLIKRIEDSSWAPVYVDDFSIILLKRPGLNMKIINSYELPGSMFTVTK